MEIARLWICNELRDMDEMLQNVTLVEDQPPYFLYSLKKKHNLISFLGQACKLMFDVLARQYIFIPAANLLPLITTCLMHHGFTQPLISLLLLKQKQEIQLMEK